MVDVEFHWDAASPYTYLAHTQVPELEKLGARVRYRPMLLGGVFKSVGTSMPAAVPAKGAYLNQDLKRWREHLGVPFLLPVEQVAFPMNSLLAMRIAANLSDDVAARRFGNSVMTALWAQGRDISDRQVLSQLLEETGVDPEPAMTRATSDGGKARLRELTDAAVARGVFGAPTFFVGTEMFFGNDRMHFIREAIRALQGRGSGA